MYNDTMKLGHWMMVGMIGLTVIVTPRAEGTPTSAFTEFAVHQPETGLEFDGAGIASGMVVGDGETVETIGSSADPLPRFEEAPCPFSASHEVLQRFRCGWLEVPENRALPDGRRLRLAVAILKSTSLTPRPDPIVFVNGGPGTTTVVRAARFATSTAWANLLAERDIILYDQRGVGLSEPEFCPSLEPETTRLPLQGPSRDAFDERMRAAFARCGAEMAERGVDLSQYNSVVSALDLRDLRVALGVREWNVWTGSYGARLTLEALRTGTEGIRAVVLDSPSPPNITLWADVPTTLVEVLERTFARCAADAACAAAFPDAERRFWQNVESLDREPMVLRTRAVDGSPDSIRLTGRLLVEAAFQGLYRSDFHAVLPLLTREIDRRNRDLLGTVAQSLQMPPGMITRGLFWTVECNEVAPFNGPDALPAPRDDRVALLQRLNLGQGSHWCDALHPYRAGPEAIAPVASDLPVLIFANALDPVTPPPYAWLAATTLPNARVVEIPGGSHAYSPRHECTRQLTREFFADPTAPLDTSCAADILPPAFVTDVHLTPGVARAALMFAPAASPMALGGSAALLLVLVSAVLGWPAAAFWARVRRRPRPAASPFERRARLGAAAVSLVVLGFLAALAWTVMQAINQNPFLLALGLPAGAAPLLWVPWILLAGSLALIVTAVLAWRREAWTPWERIHFSILAAANAVVVAALFAVGLV
jgi:pimeloyl-ACP methyl ester carboxylesterase